MCASQRAIFSFFRVSRATSTLMRLRSSASLPHLCIRARMPAFKLASLAASFPCMHLVDLLVFFLALRAHPLIHQPTFPLPYIPAAPGSGRRDFLPSSSSLFMNQYISLYICLLTHSLIVSGCIYIAVLCSRTVFRCFFRRPLRTRAVSLCGSLVVLSFLLRPSLRRGRKSVSSCTRFVSPASRRES